MPFPLMNRKDEQVQDSRFPSLQLDMANQTEKMMITAIAVCVCLIYGSFYANSFLYDDSEQILAQQPLGSLGDLVEIFGKPTFPTLPYYRPLTTATIVIQKTWHGDDPRWFHLFNSFLAGIAVWAAWLLLRIPAFKVKPVPALIAAALFGLHPAASSCVYPISSGRETLLPAVLILLATYCFLKGSRRDYWCAILVFALALFSKEQALVLPLVFVAADALKLTSNTDLKTWKDWGVRYAPILLLSLGYLSVRGVLFQGTEMKLALLEQPLGPLYSLLYAVQTSFAPFVELVYEPPLDVWFVPVRLTLSLLLTALLVWAVLRNANEISRPALFWGIWFVLLILPTANILQQECGFSERYVFLSMLGPLALLAMLGSCYWEQFPFKKFFLITGILAGGILAGISWIRGFYFENESVFFHQWVNTSPGSPTAQVHLGLVYERQARFEEALAAYQRALKIDPEFSGALINQANTLVTLQQYDAAIQLYQRALELLEDRLLHLRVGVYHNLGNAYWGKREVERAIQSYEQALHLSPEHMPSCLALADLFLQQNEPGRAATYLKKALNLKSATPEQQQEIRRVMQQYQIQ